MILSDIKRYLSQRGQATLADIALHFDADPQAVRGMLEVWIKKGKVEKLRVNAACGSSCTQCVPSATEIYRWREAGAVSAQPVVFGHACTQTGADRKP